MNDNQPVPETTSLGEIPSADNIIHVVAGNVGQAKVFARRHGIYPKYWEFLDDPKKVRGLSGSVVYTGTFYQRSNIDEIRQEVKFNPRLKVLDLDE